MVFLEISQNSQENTCARGETLGLVFSCEFCEISKNTIFYRTPLVAASVIALHKDNQTMKLGQLIEYEKHSTV